MISDTVKTQLDDLVKKQRVVLFMKGNKHFPQCGFSAQVVGILKGMNVPFETVNVLQSQEIREGIKEYSSWPTIPQLYVDGEFVGGCDIVKEMAANGELQKKLGVEVKEVPPPKVTVDAAAAKAIKEADEGNGEMLRLEIDPAYHYDLYFGPKQAGDVAVEANGVTILFDRESASRADGLQIAWVETPDGGAFKIDNPNEAKTNGAPGASRAAGVQPLSVTELKAWMDQGKAFELFDVRGEDERRVAKIDRAKALDVAGEKLLASLPKDAAIVFQCHHGMRSRNAAERLLREGYTNVHNLEGGIDAWSQKVDPKVPRY